MRRQHDVGALQSGVDEGFVFENIQGGASDLVVFESGDERGFVDNGSTRGVDKKCGRLHAEQFGGVKEAACFGKQRHVQADEVCFSEKCIHIAELGIQRFLDFLGDADGVGVDDFHLKAGSTPGDRAADTAKSDNAKGLAPNIGATELVEIPTLPVAGAGESFALGDSTGNRHQQGPGEIRGSFVKYAGSIRYDHAALGASINVDVVVADGDIARYTQLRG